MTTLTKIFDHATDIAAVAVLGYVALHGHATTEVVGGLVTIALGKRLQSRSGSD